MAASPVPDHLLDVHSRYHIIVLGTLGGSWSDRLGGMTISNTPLADGTAATTLSGDLSDQSALVGVLNTLHDCGLALISVERIIDEQDD